MSRPRTRVALRWILPPDRTGPGARIRTAFRALTAAPEYRFLRRILVVGLLVRGLLLPLTAWSLDSTGFVLGSVSLLGGSPPYASHLYFEPPLGAVLQAPLVYLAGPVWHAPLVTFDPTIVPLMLRNQLAYATIPSPAALVAVKLPMVASDLAATLLLFLLVRSRWGGPWAGTASALFWLNPAVIWASSIVGQPDTLAAAFALLFLFAVQRGAWGLAGWAAGVGAMAKLYPLLLLPVGVALLWSAKEAPPRTRMRGVLGFAAGATIAVLPFLLLLQGYGSLLFNRGTTAVSGGLSFSILFNPASPTFGGHLGNAGGAGGAGTLVLLQALGVLAVASAPVLLAVGVLRRGRTNGLSRHDLTILASLWAVLGALLLVPSPQPENFVGLLAILAVALPLMGRYGPFLVASISSATLLLILSVLGPFAYFYPLAEQLGPGAVAGVTAQGFAYWGLQGPIGHGLFWWIAGMVAGASTTLLWLILFRRLWPGQDALHDRPGASPAGAPGAAAGYPEAGVVRAVPPMNGDRVAATRDG